MVQISAHCPHCRTDKAGFSGQTFLVAPPGQENIFIMLFQCQVCSEGVVAKLHAPNSQYMSMWVQGAMSIAQAQVKVVQVWPGIIETKAPDHSPDNVASFYVQGLDNLARKNYDAAGTTFRKSLDTALKRLHPSGKGTLQQRIDSLPAPVAVTPAMKEWAHQIRELGNDAAHEEDPFTDTEAKTLHAFTEVFLTYTFTLPGMLEERKQSQQA